MVILGEVARWQPSEIRAMPSVRRMNLADVLRSRRDPDSNTPDANPAPQATQYKPGRKR